MRRRIADGRDDIFVKRIEKQTLAAWQPFWEAVSIYFSLIHLDIDDEHPEWRMHWLSLVTLLRVIGHVLAKVDGDRSETHRMLADRKWQSWKSDRGHHWIFWDFIEDERNNLLKAYHFGVEMDDDGLFHDVLGMDGQELLRESLFWWRDQLEEVEGRL